MFEGIFSDYTALFLLVAWGFTWAAFLHGGRRGEPKLPIHPQLFRYSVAVIVLVTGFYLVLLSGIGAAVIPVDGYKYFPVALGVALVLFGVWLMVVARRALRALTMAEVVFSKNSELVHGGVYRYVSHPMYWGIAATLVGSLILYPNIFGAGLLALVLFCLYRKARIEEG